jgi:hypothetical protein
MARALSRRVRPPIGFRIRKGIVAARVRSRAIGSWTGLGTSLTTTQFHLEPLGPQHNQADHAAWMSSIEHIRSTPGYPDGNWPPRSGMTLEETSPTYAATPTTSHGAPVFTFMSSTQATTTSSAASTCTPRPQRSGTSRCSPALRGQSGDARGPR